jgi:hypothetical protein
LFLLLEREIAPYILGVIDLSTVVNGQHAAKKPKLTNQAPDIALEALTPVGPIASPAASQMSNMANPKVIKISTRGRKSKGLKMAAGHSGPGSPWSSFEDQVIVFEMVVSLIFLWLALL